MTMQNGLAKAAIVAALLAVGGYFAFSDWSGWEPASDFVEKPVMLIYPSGAGGMGYKVQHLSNICRQGRGSVSWDKSGNDTILTCDRVDPLTQNRHIIKWLLRPLDVESAVAIVGLAINGRNFSRAEIEAVASSL